MATVYNLQILDPTRNNKNIADAKYTPSISIFGDITFLNSVTVNKPLKYVPGTTVKVKYNVIWTDVTGKNVTTLTMYTYIPALPPAKSRFSTDPKLTGDEENLHLETE